MAELKDPVRARLDRYGLGRVLAEDRFYATLDEAIAAYRRTYPAATLARPRPPRTNSPDEEDGESR